MLPCKCCHQRRPLWKWARWGGLIPGPVCMFCKMVGCSRCRADQAGPAVTAPALPRLSAEAALDAAIDDYQTARRTFTRGLDGVRRHMDDDAIVARCALRGLGWGELRELLEPEA